MKPRVVSARESSTTRVELRRCNRKEQVDLGECNTIESSRSDADDRIDIARDMYGLAQHIIRAAEFTRPE